MPDTIVFLTDGQASRGRLAKTKLLADLVRLWNGVARVAVHTVGIGKDHDSELLKALAAENDGYYVDMHLKKNTKVVLNINVDGQQSSKNLAQSSQPLLKKMSDKRGILVGSVVKDSPADRAGLQRQFP